ncbi:hypothetical protein EJV46_13040 [Roseococcus sp. SYP-B2431]|uniref:hypothetical protein n=1 Tax=Roseococcus sp. SYP-B2431 TaxID=2496640 RepID=UPI00103A44E9|nr:hypothetical protein [Roseococcus sp. SYP-B2431]TCH98119.1 hypothetical protein EJV46_13040 [Roseococcus sp. SYP-B2431]
MTAPKPDPTEATKAGLRRTEENGNTPDQITSHGDRAKAEPEVQAHRKGEAGRPLKELPTR